MDDCFWKCMVGVCGGGGELRLDKSKKSCFRIKWAPKQMLILWCLKKVRSNLF